MSVETPKITELANNQTIQSGLDYWRSNLELQEAHLPKLIEAGTIPEEFYLSEPENIWNLKPELKKDGANLQYVSEFYALYSKEEDLKTQVFNRSSGVHPISIVADMLGEDLVSQAMIEEPEDGSLRKGLLNALETKMSSSDVLTVELNMLTKLYGLDSMAELFGASGQGDELDSKVAEFVRTPNSIRWMRFNEENENKDPTWAETQSAALTWCTKAIEAISDMDSAEASSYVFSLSRNPDDETILDVIEKFDYFGSERIRRITRATGIRGIEAYTTEQLERMEQFANNPEALAEDLKNHDVVVLLTNRSGDHNGVLKKAAGNIEDGTDRVLFFEINRMSDIYRRMSALKKRGIQASTIVMASHSGPGQFFVSDNREIGTKKSDIVSVAGQELVARANDPSNVNGLLPGERGYSASQLAGAARIVEDYMVPSRGIDDSDEDLGRKKIIFQACYAGKEVDAFDLDKTGTKVKTGVESIISELGNTLKNSGVESTVDIYGSSEGIQMHGTSTGVSYSTAPLGIGLDREKQDAIRISLDEGKLSKSTVKEIALRKQAMTTEKVA